MCSPRTPSRSVKTVPPLPPSLSKTVLSIHSLRGNAALFSLECYRSLAARTMSYPTPSSTLPPHTCILLAHRSSPLGLLIADSSKPAVPVAFREPHFSCVPSTRPMRVPLTGTISSCASLPCLPPSAVAGRKEVAGIKCHIDFSPCWKAVS